MFARHLFCRFACAVGLFQSLAWMGNRRALEVRFDTRRARFCADCDNACDNACPMRLKPRTIKRSKFTCTQCTQCLQACETVQAGQRENLLHWHTLGEDGVTLNKKSPSAKDQSPPWKNTSANSGTL
jgi:polyferredoxin